MRPGVPLLVLASLVLAGCAEPQGARGGPAEAPLVAFMDAPADERNRTLLALREGGAADRITYLADGSWLPRLAPDVAYPDADLASLFEADAGSWERGGLVLRVERGRVPEAALAGLAPFLDGAWPEAFSPVDGPHPWYHPVLLGRMQPSAVTEAPPHGEEDGMARHAQLAALVDAFRQAEAGFVVASTQEARLPDAPAWDGCVRARTTAVPEAAVVGDVIEVRVELQNCGDEDAVLRADACQSPPSARVQLGGSAFPMLASLPFSEAPHAAYAFDLACRGEGEDVRVPAGGSVTVLRRWNGSMAACATADRCEHRPAPAGEYHLFTFASGNDEATPARVTLVSRDAPGTRLLVVRESDWVNTTSSEPIHASFGPHCAPAHYTLDPATLSVWYHDQAPRVAAGAIVRDWRGGERPGHVVTLSADRLDLAWVDDAATLRSPFDDALALAEVRVEGEDFLVDGARLGPGDMHTLRREHVVERDGGTYHVTSVLTFENAGDASVLLQRAGGCA